MKNLLLNFIAIDTSSFGEKFDGVLLVIVLVSLAMLFLFMKGTEYVSYNGKNGFQFWITVSIVSIVFSVCFQIGWLTLILVLLAAEIVCIFFASERFYEMHKLMTFIGLLTGVALLAFQMSGPQMQSWGALIVAGILYCVGLKASSLLLSINDPL